jgi:diaminohydroxyphosphoribosylaminopyrimidine deaminase/5-amino-6-(5-phosphoribosylamino)uracil reductase
VQGATAYVTLEPCSHHGRTGPCCDALAAAGIARVVATNTDPNPLVAGQGFERLRAAGVALEVLSPEHTLAQEARELNIGFFSRMVRKTPWVRMKIAASLDGKTALPNGQSQWITGPDARADGHAWRARACAVLTGIGTVLQDRPRLDVRLVPTPRQPHLVVIDSALQTPLDSPIFMEGRKLLIYAAIEDAGKTAASAFPQQHNGGPGPAHPGPRYRPRRFLIHPGLTPGPVNAPIPAKIRGCLPESLPAWGASPPFTLWAALQPMASASPSPALPTI